MTAGAAASRCATALALGASLLLGPSFGWGDFAAGAESVLWASLVAALAVHSFWRGGGVLHAGAAGMLAFGALCLCFFRPNSSSEQRLVLMLGVAFLAGQCGGAAYRRTLRECLAGLGAFALVASAALWRWPGLAESMPEWWRGAETPGAAGRFRGIFLHANVAGYVLALAHLAAGITAARTRRRLALAGLLALGGALAAALVMAQGRVLLVAWVVSACVAYRLACGGWRGSAPARWFLIATLAGSVAGYALAAESWSRRLVQLGGIMDQTLVQAAAPGGEPSRARKPVAELERMGRLEIWREGAALVRAHPLAGVGPEGFFRRASGHLHPHNLLLEVLLWGGAGAAVLMAAALASLRPRGPELALPLAAGAFTLLTGVTDSFLAFPTCGLVASLLLGSLTYRRQRRRVPLVAARQRWAAAAAVALLAAFSAAKLAHSMEQGRLPIDSHTYIAAARHAFRTGEVPYVAWPSSLLVPQATAFGARTLRESGQLPLRYFYPPSAMVAMSPLALPGSYRAATWWYWAVQLAALVAMLAGMARLLDEPRHALGAWLLLLVHPNTAGELAIGNVSLLIASVVCWALVLVREGRPGAAGLLIGIAATLKVAPAALLVLAVPLGWRAAVRMGGGALASAGAFAAASLVWLDWENWTRFGRWVAGPLSAFPPGGPNMSLLGILRPYEFAAAGLWRTPLLAALGAVLALALWRGRGRGRELEGMLGACCFIVLAMPIAWTHNSLLTSVAMIPVLFNSIAKEPRVAVALAVGQGILMSGYVTGLHWFQGTYGGPVLLAVLLAVIVRSFLPAHPAPCHLPGGDPSCGTARLSTAG